MEQDIHPEDRAYERGWAIMAEWLRQMVMPPDIPQMVDASTGDPLLFVTDHYRVLDPAGLKEVLDACPELEPDADGGWAKTVTGTDGVVRAALNIHRGKVAARLEVFYRTQRLADEGRVWFETLAGVHVRHLTRELTDPVGALRSGLDKGGTDDAGSPASGASTGIAPEAHTQMIEQVVRRIYAKWPDEQLPALGNRTPREAIRTRAGLERVKGLLRMYAADEDERARSERRAPVSYGFLWEALGIGPE
jgi:hypothetical protein